MGRVEYTKQAEEDILDIAFYIAQDNLAAAHRFIEKVSKTCEAIGTNPGMGRPRDELVENLRSHPMSRYVIYYRPLADRTLIIRVLHGSRDISDLL